MRAQIAFDGVQNGWIVVNGEDDRLCHFMMILLFSHEWSVNIDPIFPFYSIFNSILFKHFSDIEARLPAVYIKRSHAEGRRPLHDNSNEWVRPPALPRHCLPLTDCASFS